MIDSIIWDLFDPLILEFYFYFFWQEVFSKMWGVYQWCDFCLYLCVCGTCRCSVNKVCVTVTVCVCVWFSWFHKRKCLATHVVISLQWRWCVSASVALSHASLVYYLAPEISSPNGFPSEHSPPSHGPLLAFTQGRKRKNSSGRIPHSFSRSQDKYRDLRALSLPWTECFYASYFDFVAL